MLVDDLLPTIQALPKREKLQLLRLLVEELAKDEGLDPTSTREDYPVWTPHNAFEAADVLLGALAADQQASDD